MKMNVWFPVFMVLALSGQGAPPSVMAETNLRIAERQVNVADAVFHLSEQAKKEEMIAFKNRFLEVRAVSKVLPIEPILGNEIKPDPVEVD